MITWYKMIASILIANDDDDHDDDDDNDGIWMEY
jgi:hypothetical protein